uniref:Metalloendopeptidase n=1 Tax=Periophthalmus magnuspinnatus TaxID=409849 RepID=A0A3B4BDD1_9GOBI
MCLNKLISLFFFSFFMTKDNEQYLASRVLTKPSVKAQSTVIMIPYIICVAVQTDRNAVQSIWPTHAIPYLISAELRKQSSRTNDILSATRMVSDQTCVTFHLRTFETNFLHFKNSPGCSSYVGFIGGDQAVYIGSVCTVGNIAHELLHALGFYHEHTRMDRDSYINIIKNNIIKGTEQNFVKRHGDTLNVPYDTASILHYGRAYFSSNGSPTIVPLHTAKDMGQRERLTQLDILRVRLLYQCGV